MATPAPTPTPAEPRPRSARNRKIAAAGAALLIEGGLILALMTGLAQKFVRSVVPDSLTVVDVSPDPPPSPPPQRVDKPAGSAAPAGTRTKATPQPQPEIALAAPTPAAAAASGAAAAGMGSGAGGSGNGTGAGGSGNGAGSGGAGSGIASGPQRVAGAVSDRDYPRDAGRAGGTVGVAFRVRSDGAVDQCRVIASSGSARLDGLTCGLVEQRFRYRPATDAAGRPVEASLRTSFTYGPR